VRFAVLVVVLVSAALIAASASSALVPRLYKNCTAFHKRYPHGVGRLGAHDKSAGTPVTTFKHSTRIYNTAKRYNGSLDRDKDGIACEKA
jgi:hypothetical protein